MLDLHDTADLLRRLRNELNLSMPQFESLVELAGVAAIVFDSRGTILSANSKATLMLGFTAEELAGSSLAPLLWAGSQHDHEQMSRILDPETHDTLDLALRGKSGRKTPVHMIFKPIVRATSGAKTKMLVMIQKDSSSSMTELLDRCECGIRGLSERLAASHETEVQRISAELHDGISQMLALIKFTLENASRRLHDGKLEEGSQIVSEAVLHLHEAMADVRRISRKLPPGGVDDFGLIESVRQHCRRYGNAYRKIDVASHFALTEADIPQHLKPDIYRIIQEAMHNSVKHSNATLISVSLGIAHFCLFLRIRDNGKGLDTGPVGSGVDGQSGAGLKNLRTRVESTGGRFMIAFPGDACIVEACWTLSKPAPGMSVPESHP